MAMPAHLTLTGEKQGKIEGSCEMKGREGTILVYGMTHSVSIPTSSTDGLSTGKRVHGALNITKEYDKSSPKLYQALCSGEHLSNVTIKWYRITPVTLLSANDPQKDTPGMGPEEKTQVWKMYVMLDQFQQGLIVSG